MEHLKVSEIAGLSVLSDNYDAVFCDVWGVLHNGVAAFSKAREALSTLRKETGCRVILLTNAPRPDWWVAHQLATLGIGEEAYDAIVTSGDVTRHAIESHGEVKLYALGPERDRNFYDGLNIQMVGPDEADLVSITGLIDDEQETPDDYHEMLSGFLSRGLEVICANPDIVVERGDRLVYCGGALAEKYREMGGNALYFGKPHAPIYDLARKKASGLFNGPLSDARILAIGDGIATDVKGANYAGLDCLFVTGGIHAAEDGPLARPTPESVGRFLEEKGRKAKGFMPALSW